LPDLKTFSSHCLASSTFFLPSRCGAVDLSICRINVSASLSKTRSSPGADCGHACPLGRAANRAAAAHPAAKRYLFNPIMLHEPPAEPGIFAANIPFQSVYYGRARGRIWRLAGWRRGFEVGCHHGHQFSRVSRRDEEAADCGGPGILYSPEISVMSALGTGKFAQRGTKGTPGGKLGS
jgi:hypothetical protein